MPAVTGRVLHEERSRLSTGHGTALCELHQRLNCYCSSYTGSSHLSLFLPHNEELQRNARSQKSQDHWRETWAQLEEDGRNLWLSRVSLSPCVLLIFSSRWARLLTSISILCAQFVEIFPWLSGFQFICLLDATLYLYLCICMINFRFPLFLFWGIWNKKIGKKWFALKLNMGDRVGRS
jgi:hypothetical protein